MGTDSGSVPARTDPYAQVRILNMYTKGKNTAGTPQESYLRQRGGRIFRHFWAWFALQPRV